MALRMRRAEFVVLGGGISGLAAAYYLRLAQKGDLNASRLVAQDEITASNKNIVVLEAGPTFGGCISSFVTPEGSVHERGTRSIRPAGVVGKNTLDLVSALGIQDKVVPVSQTHPAARNRFIYANNSLHRLPSSLGDLVRRQDPFTQRLLPKLLREPFAAKCNEDDESIHDFFSRRLGEEVARFLVDPFCRGIFAGSSRHLSMKACFPAVFAAERTYGSIILGSLRSKPEQFPNIGTSKLAKRAEEEKWSSWTMANGLHTLPQRLVEWLDEEGVEVRKSAPCSRIKFERAGDGGAVKQVAKVVTDEGIWEANHVICATSSQAAHSLVSPEHAQLASLLHQITSTTVAVVNLEYQDLQLPVTGFGYLVPSFVESNVLGVIFDSCAYPELDRRKDPTTRLTCMMGGTWFRDLFGDPTSVDQDHLVHLALEAIGHQIGINKTPVYTRVSVLHDCIPQYKLGHSTLVDYINAYVQTHRLPLTLVGSSYNGVTVNDCIFQARKAVTSLTT